MERLSLMDGVHPTIKAAHSLIDHWNAMHTRQLIDRLRSIRANITLINGHYGEPTPEEREAAEAEANSIKAILATREHIPNKAESKQIRQYKQHRKQTR